MSDAIDELIQEIASKNGMAVSRDDPILVLHTINTRLLEDSARAQQVMLDSFKEELESITHRWGGDAKEKAERILNAALTASRETMAKAMQESTKATAEAVTAEVDTALRRVRSQLQDVKRIAVFNIVAGVMAFAAAGIVLFASLSL